MIHYRAGIKTVRNRTKKRYVLAVVFGVLLGSAYAVAGPALEKQALALPKPVLAHSPQVAQSPGGDDGCAPGPVGVVFPIPKFISEHDGSSQADAVEPVCTWAI